MNLQAGHRYLLRLTTGTWSIDREMEEYTVLEISPSGIRVKLEHNAWQGWVERAHITVIEELLQKH